MNNEDFPLVPSTASEQDVFYDPSGGIQLVGMPVYFKKGYNSVRRATANVVYNGTYFALITAAHAHDAAVPAESSSQDGDDMDMPFDDESESDIEEPLCTPQLPITRSQTSELSATEPLEGKKYLSLGTISEVLRAVDCILVILRTDDAVNSLIRHRDATKEMVIHSSNNMLSSTNVTAWTSRGPIQGSIHGPPTLMRLSQSDSFELAFKFIYPEDNQIRVGDCGTWVTDMAGGELYGHIVSMSEHSRIAYVVAAEDLKRNLDSYGKWKFLFPLNAPKATAAPLSPDFTNSVPLLERTRSQWEVDSPNDNHLSQDWFVAEVNTDEKSSLILEANKTYLVDKDWYIRGAAVEALEKQQSLSDDVLTAVAETGQHEAIEYLSQLIQAHLVATMTHMQGQGPTSPENISTCSDECEVVSTQCFIAGFERDNDSVLACLLKGLLHARKTADGATNEAIKAVLRRPVEIALELQEDANLGAHAELASLKNSGAIKQFFLNVLEDLLRRGQGNDEDEDTNEDYGPGDEMEEGVSYSDSFSSFCTHPTIRFSTGHRFSTGDTVLDVRFDGLLSFLWKNEMNTDCDVCAKSFQNEPPIRTFCKLQESEETTLHIRVFNRHFACLEEGKHAFVPISHVWHDSIRDANMDAKPTNAGTSTKAATSTREATSTVLSTLEALFEGAEDAYLPEVEFWHDYVSVPQWEPEIKDALLLLLPAIYHRADEILVHLADMPNPFISILLLASLTGPPRTVKEAIDRILPLRILCSSEWMQRMWVTLEYSQCKAACIMGETNHIVRSADGSGFLLFGRDTFTNLIQASHNQLNELFRYASSFCDSLSLPGDFLASLTEKGVKGSGLNRLCLGEALELVNKKCCSEERDRLLAIYLLLNPESAPTNRPKIPKDSSEACFWLWKYALLKGDYSPLLLQPKELNLSSNPGDRIPSWAVGWNGLAKGEWRLGDQKVGPTRSPILIDGAMRLDLDVIGTIERIHHLGVKACGQLFGIEWTLRLLVSIAQRDQRVLSSQELLVSLNSVFPLDIMHSYLTSNIASIDLLDKSILNNLLEGREIIGSTGDSTVAYRNFEWLAKEIAEKLQFEQQLLKPIASNVTRLNRSRVLAERRMERGAVGGEPICER
ncbi:hypothetical protein G6514_002539 [Epicoccum nigrum]|nr:hypothetical protein G6514_002539 [Epicoccum nigrum]